MNNIMKSKINLKRKLKQKIIQQGAEAVIKLIDGKVVKERVEKGYRWKDLDDRLRKSRTRGEGKIMGKLSKVVDVPIVFDVDDKDFKIEMEFIDGLKLSEDLECEGVDWRGVCKMIGKGVGKIHDEGIVHGDLTTSNLILKDNKVYFIDFGLGFHSNKIEDKAVDLHLLKQALGAKHFKIAEKAFEIVLKNYGAQDGKEIIERIEVMAGRGRYRDKH